MSKPTRVDYCQYLLSTPLNYTLTHFADHSESFSHDQINRYLAKDRLTSRQVWEHVRPDLIETCDGYIIFDDTPVEKPSASEIPLAPPNILAMPGKSSMVSVLSPASTSIPI